MRNFAPTREFASRAPPELGGKHAGCEDRPCRHSARRGRALGPVARRIHGLGLHRVRAVKLNRGHRRCCSRARFYGRASRPSVAPERAAAKRPGAQRNGVRRRAIPPTPPEDATERSRQPPEGSRPGRRHQPQALAAACGDQEDPRAPGAPPGVAAWYSAFDGDLNPPRPPGDRRPVAGVRDPARGRHHAGSSNR